MSLGIKFVCKFIKSLIKTNSQVHEPKTYNKEINDLIYKKKWCKTSDKKL